MIEIDMNKSLENFKKNFKFLANESAKKAVKLAQVQIHNKANQFISDYYKYSPRIYKDRKKSLYKLVEDVYTVHNRQDCLDFEFGIIYNPKNIKGMHKSNSKYHKSGDKWVSRFDDVSSFKFDKGDNGIPEPEWITDNFYNGIHPGFVVQDNKRLDKSKRDKFSPDEKMQKFFDNELYNDINLYISNNLLYNLKMYLS